MTEEQLCLAYGITTAEWFEQFHDEKERATMSRKPLGNPAFHDSSDPRYEQHAQSGEPARPERRCPKCRAKTRRRAVRP